ncbi:DUF3105 domain-containing protein [Allorhizocola rhizosphaerae]|uniref:DUF3105 domain-containing protein n=1 Tax=Allorhizocola rhizosphaerae TaxID=1872709 RepID=UPI000E3C0928|nr:DUF3105 domain-containing protein [Allorhizocola rhizosphaerae]
MSISTPSGEQNSPSVVKVSGKPSAKPGAKPGGKGGGKPAAGGKGGGPRRPQAPVKVGQGRNWGPIALFVAVGVIAVGIIIAAAWPSFGPGGSAYPWEQRASQIEGIVNFRANGTELKRDHAWGTQTYAQNPPVGGPHNAVWQQCMGNIYDAPIPNEHAVHSLEHGAVWVTYRSGLPADQVEVLANKVRGKQFTMLSPVDNLDKPVSLQAWGYQLKLDDVNDARIDKFIEALAKNATLEPQVGCGEGNTATGTTPLTEQQVQQRFGQGQ